jgi:hypothetical protein
MNVVVKLQGGLGNQMFQYAFGKNISDITNRKLILDLSFLNRRDLGPDFVYRNYDLDIFNLENVSVVNFYDGDYDLIIDNFNPNSTMDSINLNIKDILQNSSDTIYLDGYWSSPLYFNKIDFTFNESCLTYSNDLLFDIQNTNSVMLNIRRADFLNNDFHGTYGKDYILKGINKLKSNFSDLKFFIFSDDIEWCKNNLSDIPNSIIVTHEHKGNKFYNYLLLMSECKHFIIPNSTFAWWAAYLSKNKNKKVLYPEIWLKSFNSECKLLYFGLDWEKNS